jgi:hypothetical protein
MLNLTAFLIASNTFNTEVTDNGGYDALIGAVAAIVFVWFVTGGWIKNPPKADD